ncbi:MAG TPA: hypothetical protein VMG31_01645 [Verrucomicrobiae bacterium]|nr:hypothetical protein [Verrucomicrobiae bacterium]
MKLTVRRMALGATILASALLSSALAQVQVGTCVSGLTSYATIQQAVNASIAGTTIEVCPGNYPEQVTIAKSLTLKGVTNSAGQAAAVVVSPSGGLLPNASDVDTGLPIAAQILVQNTTGVLIKKLGVNGANNGLSGCATDVTGILFQNASGTVNDVAVRDQTLTPSLYGCQDGEGIFVQTASGFTSALSVANSSVRNYQKNGITGNDPGTTISVFSNDVQGWGPTPSIAQNGIQIAFGATGTVSGNVVIDDVYMNPACGGPHQPVCYGSSGILLYDGQNGNIVVSSNTVGNTQYAIALVTDDFAPAQYDDGVTVSGNQILGSSDFDSTLATDAIDVCTDFNSISGNTIMNSGESAIHLDSSCSGSGNNTGSSNVVSRNTINDSACAGILADSVTNANTDSGNTFFNVPFTIASSTTSCTYPAVGPVANAVRDGVAGLKKLPKR